MVPADVRADLERLQKLIDAGRVEVQEVADAIGVSRQIITRWRKNAQGNMTARNAARLREFVARFNFVTGSPIEPGPRYHVSPTTEGGTGVHMDPEHMRILADIISLPPELQKTLKSTVESLKQLAERLEESKQKELQK